MTQDTDMPTASEHSRINKTSIALTHFSFSLQNIIMQMRLTGRGHAVKMATHIGWVNVTSTVKWVACKTQHCSVFIHYYVRLAFA